MEISSNEASNYVHVDNNSEENEFMKEDCIVPLDDETAKVETELEENLIQSSSTTTNIKLNSTDDDVIDKAVVPAQNSIIFPFDWSEMFKSPITPGFSPSRIGSHHGLGLQLAIKTNKSTAISLGNISTFIASVANVYEQLGVNLITVSQSIIPQELTLKTSIDNDFQSLHDSILALGSGFHRSGECYRNTIVSSLQNYLTKNGKLSDEFIQLYTESRQASVEARKDAIANFSIMTNAANAIETEIQLWLQILLVNKNDGTIDESEGQNDTLVDTQSECLPWEKNLKDFGQKAKVIEPTDRIIQKLKTFLLQETRYFESVSKENESIKATQELEALVLKNVQKMEQDLLNIFVDEILVEVFPKYDSKYQCVSVNTPIKFQTSGDVEKPFTEGIEKGKDLLVNLFKQQSVPYEKGQGIMDCETLGLPESVGLQREKVKASFAGRDNRIRITGIVVKLFEEMIDVTSKSSSRLRSQIIIQRKRSSEEKSPIENTWLSVLGMLEDEAKLISEATIKASKLINWYKFSKKNLANEIELDDSAWKHICDGARAEMRFETKYKQTKQQIHKARQRASSKEIYPRAPSEPSDDMGTPNRVGRAFFNGGEIMKKLAEKSIVQIQQIGMNEVDQKEAKDKLALNEASASKEKAILAYTAYTTERIKKLELEDDAGWSEMGKTITKLSESIKALHKVRCTVFEERISKDLQGFIQTLIEDIEKWSESVPEKILESDRKLSSTKDGVPEEYALTKKIIRTRSIVELLNVSEMEESIINKLKVLNESKNAELSKEGIDTCDVTVETGSEILNTQIKSASSTNTNEDKSISTPVERQVMDNVEERPGMKAFVEQFWSHKLKNEKLPDILGIYTCAYRPKDKAAFLNPFYPGKLYTTIDGLYFLGPEKHFSFKWETILNIKKERGFMGTNNDSDLVITCRSTNTIVSLVFCRFRSRDNALIHLQSLKEKSGDFIVTKVENGINSNVKEAQLQPVQPDLLLQKMEIVLSKTIKNVSIGSIFKNVWADRSFYDSWLREEECFDISLEEWQYESGVGLRNDWCNEKYDRKRLVTFKFNRSTHLYLGPPIALVKQHHYCRVDGEDKCVVAISASFDGIPYSDSFSVEMRWVATRKGNNDLLIQVGLFVVFKKNTMLKSQITSGTIQETKNVHIRLFNAVKKVCVGSEGEHLEKIELENKVDEDIEEKEQDITKIKQSLLNKILQKISGINASFIASSIGVVAILFASRLLIRATLSDVCHSNNHRLEIRIEELLSEVRALRKSIDLVVAERKF